MFWYLRGDNDLQTNHEKWIYIIDAKKTQNVNQIYTENKISAAYADQTSQATESSQSKNLT